MKREDFIQNSIVTSQILVTDQFCLTTVNIDINKLNYSELENYGVYSVNSHLNSDSRFTCWWCLSPSLSAISWKRKSQSPVNPKLFRIWPHSQNSRLVLNIVIGRRIYFYEIYTDTVTHFWQYVSSLLKKGYLQIKIYWGGGARAMPHPKTCIVPQSAG